MFAFNVSVNELKNKSPERVLYIGNSYLYYNDSLHNHVRRMLEESYGYEFDRGNYKSVTISGSRTSHHNIDYPLNHVNLGAEKPFELVILQGGSGESNTLEERKNNPDKFEVIDRPRKHRYIYFIGNKNDKKQILKQLKYPVMEYPKFQNTNYKTNTNIQTQGLLI